MLTCNCILMGGRCLGMSVFVADVARCCACCYLVQNVLRVAGIYNCVLRMFEVRRRSCWGLFWSIGAYRMYRSWRVRSMSESQMAGIQVKCVRASVRACLDVILSTYIQMCFRGRGIRGREVWVRGCLGVYVWTSLGVRMLSGVRVSGDGLCWIWDRCLGSEVWCG